MAIAEHDEVRKIERYRWYTTGLTTALVAGGVVILMIMSFGIVILPPAIEIVPDRMRPFAMPVCPGESIQRSVTYIINRPTILEVDAMVYDLSKARPVPTTAVASSRPSPYAVRETIPFTFTVPNLPPSRYEWQVGITPKNQSATTAFWFVEFEVKEGCPPLPTPEATP
jgi:hypothetical protein